MMHLSPSIALILWPLASVLSLSVPASQQIAQSNRSHTALPNQRANLTFVPPIPHFEAKIRFDAQATLGWSEVYANALGAMRLLAIGDYDSIISTALYVPAMREELVLEPISPPGAPSALQSKHAVQAILEAGNQLAAKGISSFGLVPRMFATLELHGRPIGFMKWQHRTSRGATSTSGIIGDETVDIARLGEATTSSLQISRRADQTGVIPFPRRPEKKIHYEISETAIPVSEMFSCFLAALANAATHDMLERDAYVNAVSVSGTVSLNMHGDTIVPENPPLWYDLMETFYLLWDHVVLVRSASFEFFLEWDGLRLGEGFVMMF